MTDLEINIELAKAMGWVEISGSDFTLLKKTGFRVVCDEVICAYNFCLLDFRFDYRDPVIFVAICKRWKLRAAHDAGCVLVDGQYGKVIYDDCIEKAAALCVIDAVKRGAK